MLVSPSSLLLLALSRGCLCTCGPHLLSQVRSRDAQENFNPIGTLPCKSAPHRSAFQLAGRCGGGWLGLFAEHSGAAWRGPSWCEQRAGLWCSWAASEQKQSACCLVPPGCRARVPLPAPGTQVQLSTSGSSGQDPGVLLDTPRSFDPAVLVLLILATSQPSSTSLFGVSYVI